MAGPERGPHALSDRVARAHASGQVFTRTSLFSIANPRHTPMLGAASILLPRAAEIRRLYQQPQQALSLSLSTAAGKTYTLELLRTHPTGARPNMGTINMAGRHQAPYASGLHYQGSLQGDVQSIATMSVFENGEVMLLFSNHEGNFVLGRLEDGSGQYILYNDKDLQGREATTCGVVDPPVDVVEGITAAKTASALLCNKVRVYWEVAYLLYADKGFSLTNIQNYITGLFNQVQAVYANENVALELSSMYVWTTPDDYPTTPLSGNSGSGRALDAFQSYWNSLGNSFDGDLAHLLHRTAGGLGGVAYVDALCNTNGIGYAFSDLRGFYNTVPTYSWDVEVIAHETGHNLGSRHTHWCGWMTGPGGSCGAIDNCYPKQAAGSCTSCGQLTDTLTAPAGWQGTIMSYCHLSSRGINLANGFGALPGNLIRNNVSSRSCMQPTIHAELTPNGICNGSGSIGLQFAPNHFGTPPYQFTWTGGSNAQNLNSITTPGTYTVRVADSNGCSETFAVDVTEQPFSGTAVPHGVPMPICCNNASTPLLLQASVPKGLTSCHSVYWIKSPSALSQADAWAYFDTTASANILKSTNESSIANNTTGATLSVLPEPCSTNQTWFYTPVVARLARAADSIVQHSSASNSYMLSGTQIGAFTSLAGQLNATKACDLLDMPNSAAITVTVANYNGRAGKMRITIQDTTGLVVYQSAGLAGNGTYTIPASDINGNILQYLKIIAADYNCTVAATGPPTRSCTATQASVSATRKVKYDARKARMDMSCAMSAPIQVDFAPTGCTKLSIQPLGNNKVLALHPNPAGATLSLGITLQTASVIRWKISDVTGRTVRSSEASYTAGSHSTELDVSQWARGVYLVTLSDQYGNVEQSKLILQ